MTMENEQVVQLQEQLARVEAERDGVQIDAMAYAEQRDTAQARLAEADALLTKVMHCTNFREIGEVEMEIAAYFARHDQAEQQEARVSKEQWQALAEAEQTLDVIAASREERAKRLGLAQGVQAGDERAAFEGLAKAQGLSVTRTTQGLAFANGTRRDAGDYIDLLSLVSWHFWQARAALATQPAAGEPKAEFFVEFETLRKAMSIYGLAAPASNSELGALMERYAVELIEAVADRPFPCPPAAAHGDEAVRWVPCSERLPEVAQFDQQEFIVSVQRKDKVITMSALYLNAYPLHCEDHDDADDEGYVPHTGWYDAKSNGDDANCYNLVNDSWYGSTVTHWMHMPKPAAAVRAQAGERGEV